MSAPSESGLPVLYLQCPVCRQPTDSLKWYRTILMVFFIIGAWWQRKNTIACPKCMKGKLLEFAGVNLVTANIGWPIAILPATIAYWMDLSTPGHSTLVLEEAQSGLFGNDVAAIAREILKQPRNKHPFATRFFGLGLMFVSFIAFVATTVLLAKHWYELGSRFGGSMAIAVGVAGLAVALFRYGLSRARLRSFSWKAFGLSILAGAALFAIFGPAVSMGFWRWRERAESSNERWYYYDIPAPLWRAEPLKQNVVWLLRDFEQLGSMKKYDLERVVREIEAHHAGDSEFAAIAADIRKALEKQKVSIAAPAAIPEPSSTPAPAESEKAPEFSAPHSVYDEPAKTDDKRDVSFPPTEGPK